MADLQRPDDIPGYEHPTKSKYSHSGIYKTFTEGKKAGKKGKEDKFGITTVEKQYATYGDINEDLCPQCDNYPIYTCPCGHSDKKCENDHIWYTDRDGNVKTGNPHC